MYRSKWWKQNGYRATKIVVAAPNFLDRQRSCTIYPTAVSTSYRPFSGSRWKAPWTLALRWKAPGLKPKLTYRNLTFHRGAFVKGLFTCYPLFDHTNAFKADSIKKERMISWCLYFWSSLETKGVKSLKAHTGRTLAFRLLNVDIYIYYWEIFQVLI